MPTREDNIAMIQIRQAHHADIDALLDLQEQYWNFEQLDHFDRGRNRTLIGDFLNRPHYGALLVAQSPPNRLAGYIIACFQYSFEYGGIVATVDELYVEAQSRSLGIGSALFMQLETYVRSLEGVAIALEVDHHNVSAIAFYLKHGFERRSKYQTMLKELRSAP
jgi:ribosomal protein S18 acetylase RimI-like enzyme